MSIYLTVSVDEIINILINLIEDGIVVDEMYGLPFYKNEIDKVESRGYDYCFRLVEHMDLSSKKAVKALYERKKLAL